MPLVTPFCFAKRSRGTRTPSVALRLPPRAVRQIVSGTTHHEPLFKCIQAILRYRHARAAAHRNATAPFIKNVQKNEKSGRKILLDFYRSL